MKTSQEMGQWKIQVQFNNGEKKGYTSSLITRESAILSVMETVKKNFPEIEAVKVFSKPLAI